MTKNKLLFWIRFTIFIFAMTIVGGVVLKIFYPDKDSPVYNTYKDVMPLIIAMPAAWLSYCFQRRSSYLQALRTLWNELIHAVNKAIEYTRWQIPPSEADYQATITSLCSSIDAIRIVFRNIPTDNLPRGLYPYENLKDILHIVRKLGYGDNFSQEEYNKARKDIERLWSEMRLGILEEFDTDIPTPTCPVSKYLDANLESTDRVLDGGESMNSKALKMNLDAKEKSRLARILISRFNPEEVWEVAHYHLSLPEVVVHGRSARENVRELIEYAVKCERLGDLIDVLSEYRPDDSEIQNFVKDVCRDLDHKDKN